MFWINGYATVFQPEIKDKFVKSNLSTSEKDKEGNYVNSNWSGAIFVNSSAHKAFDNAQKLNDRDRILIKSGKLSKRKYTDKDGNQKFGDNIIIFDFEVMASRDELQGSDGGKKPSKPTTFASMDDIEEDDPAY